SSATAAADPPTSACQSSATPNDRRDPAPPNPQKYTVNGQKLIRKNDRGPKGTHHGAIISNGNLYCPRTPRPLLELGPLARTATSQQAADHDRKTAELAAASPAASPPATPTATTASSARPPWAR